MCTSRIRAFVGVMVGALGLGSGVGFAATPACPDGRYLVFRQTLLGAATADKLDGLTVQGGTVALDSGCPSRPAHMTSSRAGTKIAATWDHCGSLESVRLRAVVTGAGCDVVNGSVAVRQQPTRPFTGRRSSCGDGVVDGGAGEACEQDADCGATAVCAACACNALPTTTTTTTTTLPPTVRLQVGIDPPDAGIVTGDGIACGTDSNNTVSSQCGSAFAPESLAALHVTPTNFQYDFVGWTGCQENVPGNEFWCSVAMHGDQVAVARFARVRSYVLEFSTTGWLEAGGSPTCAWAAIASGALHLRVTDAGDEAQVKLQGDASVSYFPDSSGSPDDPSCGTAQSAVPVYPFTLAQDWGIARASAWPAGDTVYLRSIIPLGNQSFFGPYALSGFLTIDGTIGPDGVLYAKVEFVPTGPVYGNGGIIVNATASPTGGG